MQGAAMILQGVYFLKGSNNIWDCLTTNVAYQLNHQLIE
jgi:hypothetical protein